MRNIRIEVTYDDTCSYCNGYGELDTASNRESRAGIEKIRNCEHCNGSGSETRSCLVSLKDLAKEIAALNKEDEE